MSALFSQKDYVISTHNDRRSRNRKLVVSPDDEIEMSLLSKSDGGRAGFPGKYRIGDRGSGIEDRGSRIKD